jgi:archaemetzincin
MRERLASTRCQSHVLRALALVLLCGCQAKKPVTAVKAPRDAGHHAPAPKDTFAKLAPLHPAMSAPAEGDWRERFDEERQSFEQFQLAAQRPMPGRDVLYVVTIGDTTKAQDAIIADTIKLLSTFFAVEVRALDRVPADDIPAKERRTRRPGWQQLRSPYVLEKVLPRLKPKDAIALLAFTAEDLYPAPNWNFVFGEASIEDRTGIWSLYRFGDPETERELVLRRTIKTAAHEAAHSFGLLHCTEALCLMNGANSLAEADESPLEPCPACLRKLQWAFGFDVRDRFKQLQKLETEVGLSEESEDSAAALAALGQ